MDTVEAIEAERLTAVVEFLAGERKPMTPKAIAYGITDARGWGCDWPAGSVKDFEQAVEQAVKAGRLQVVDGGQVWLATELAKEKQATKPTKKTHDAQTLFDFD